uniref:Uncharacterized protein n=1 Tax=Paramormyrops kingsleyae TaxID=1676925 RepID=A0A3B3QC13_9TELE
MFWRTAFSSCVTHFSPAVPDPRVLDRGKRWVMDANAVELLSRAVTAELNVSDCWVCHYMPHTAGWVCSTQIIITWTVDAAWMAEDPERYGARVRELTVTALQCRRSPDNCTYSAVSCPSDTHVRAKGTTMPEDGLAVIPVNETVCFHLFNSAQSLALSSPPLHCRAYVNFSVLGDVLLVAPPRSVFVCGRKDSLKGYIVLSLSTAKVGWYCYLAYLVPPIRVVPKEQMSLAVRAYSRGKRSLSRTEQWFGVFIPSLGVSDLQTEVAALQTAVEKVANQTLDTVQAVQGELSAIKQVALQNRMALDILLAEKGGVCAIVGRECFPIGLQWHDYCLTWLNSVHIIPPLLLFNLTWS